MGSCWVAILFGDGGEGGVRSLTAGPAPSEDPCGFFKNSFTGDKDEEDGSTAFLVL